MSADSVVRARIDSDTKARATEALNDMGLTVSDAIRLLLLRVADEKRLPFAVQVPNRSTLEAMKELDERKGQRFGSVEELFDDPEEADPVREAGRSGAERRPHGRR